MDVSFLEPGWRRVLGPELASPQIEALCRQLSAERGAGRLIYPPAEAVFRAFETPFEQVKVVILGQDPYHGPGQAMGLAFSVPAGQAPPPSLRNIFTELSTDLGLERPRTGLVYMLWGAQAQKARQLIKGISNLVLEAPHPSPLSARRGFFGCRHFSQANAYLRRAGLEPVDWRLP